MKEDVRRLLLSLGLIGVSLLFLGGCLEVVVESPADGEIFRHDEKVGFKASGDGAPYVKWERVWFTSEGEEKREQVGKGKEVKKFLPIGEHLIAARKGDDEVVFTIYVMQGCESDDDCGSVEASGTEGKFCHTYEHVCFIRPFHQPICEQYVESPFATDEPKEYCWFLGENTGWETDPSFAGPFRTQNPYAPTSPSWLTDWISDTDLGISVPFKGKTYVYMGDTWWFPDTNDNERRNDFLANPSMKKNPFCDPNCPFDVPEDQVRYCSQCDDAIVVVNDTTPENGLRIEWLQTEFIRVLVGTLAGSGDVKGPRYRYLIHRFKGISIPGVHTDYNKSDWGTLFNTPTGAVKANIPRFEVTPVSDEDWQTEPISLYEETIFLWYTTSSSQNEKGMLSGEDIIYSKSWLGKTTDGVSFENCYSMPVAHINPEILPSEWSERDRIYYPFSASNIDSLKHDPEATGKFLGVSPVVVDRDIGFMDCFPPDYGEEINDDKAILMFGSGVPSRESNMYLAYAPMTKLCGELECDGLDCHPKYVRYFQGGNGANCWSENEEDAVPLFPDQVFDGDFRFILPPDVPNHVSAGVGEHSIKLINAGDPESETDDIFVMLSNENWCEFSTPGGICKGRMPTALNEAGVIYRWAPRMQPWNWSWHVKTDAQGYGPFQVEKMARYYDEKHSTLLTHMSSTWLGTQNEAYGVQSTQTEVGLGAEMLVIGDSYFDFGFSRFKTDLQQLLPGTRIALNAYTGRQANCALNEVASCTQPVPTPDECFAVGIPSYALSEWLSYDWTQSAEIAYIHLSGNDYLMRSLYEGNQEELNCPVDCTQTDCIIDEDDLAESVANSLEVIASHLESLRITPVFVLSPVSPIVAMNPSFSSYVAAILAELDNRGLETLPLTDLLKTNPTDPASNPCCYRKDLIHLSQRHHYDPTNMSDIRPSLWRCPGLYGSIPAGLKTGTEHIAEAVCADFVERTTGAPPIAGECEFMNYDSSCTQY